MKYTAKTQLMDKFITIYFFNNKEQYSKFTEAELGLYVSGNAYCNYQTRVLAIGVFDNELSTLTHELYHTIEYINDLCHEENDKNIYFSEANAYLIAYLFKQFERLVQKTTNKTRKKSSKS